MHGLVDLTSMFKDEADQKDQVPNKQEQLMEIDTGKKDVMSEGKVIPTYTRAELEKHYSLEYME